MSSSDEQESQGNRWVPLAEAPFKLRFGWDLPDGADENDLENDSQYLVSCGWACVRWLSVVKVFETEGSLIEGRLRLIGVAD